MSDGAPIWRRLAAAAIDGIFFILAASVISVALYAATDGRFRAYVFLPMQRCAPVETLSPAVAQAAGAALPGARVVSATACRRLFLGLESGRFMSVRLEAQEGRMARIAFVTQPVNRRGEPVRPLTLGWAYPLAFVVSMALGEGLMGGTPGKAALSLRVSDRRGRRLGFVRALARNAIIYAVLLAGALLVAVLPFASGAFGEVLAHPGYIWTGMLAVLGLLALGPLVLLALWRPDPLYDHWTGARVVRV